MTRIHVFVKATLVLALAMSVGRVGQAADAAAPAAPAAPAVPPVLITNGQRLAFYGDEITQLGITNPSGWAQLVVKGLDVNGYKVVPIAAGGLDERSPELLARLKKSVVDKKPDWVIVSCGTYDVNGISGARPFDPVPLEQYKTNMTAIVDGLLAAKIKVLLLTATPIGEDPAVEKNKVQVEYNKFLTELAKTKNVLLADINAQFFAAAKATGISSRALQLDGLTLNPAGDEAVALGVLQAFVLAPGQIDKAKSAWELVPDRWSVRVHFAGSSKARSLSLLLPLTRAQYTGLQKVAASRPRAGSVADLLNASFTKSIRALLQPRGNYANLDAIFNAGQDKIVLVELRTELAAQIEEMLTPPAPVQ